MKYFELMKPADNSVGAVFAYCNQEDLNKLQEEFEPTNTTEITKDEYEEAAKRQQRKFLRTMTGYPK